MPLRTGSDFEPGKPGDNGRRIVLVAAMKDEGPFILEWLSYHLAIGFTDIVVCTNDCVDDSPRLLDRLQELEAVTHLPIRVGVGEKPQLAAYARAEESQAVRNADWAMVLDADEFLNVHIGSGTVPELIEAVPRATAFLFNWRIFGSSGHKHWRPEFVTERFTKAAPLDNAVNLSFKTLFTRLDIYGCKLLPHQPRFPDENRLSELCYVNGAGTALPRYFFDETGGDFLQSEPDQVSWGLAQINHYNTRSWEDYLVKHARGGGITRNWDRDANWAIFDRNEETDFSISGKLHRAKAVFERLLSDEQVRDRHHRCCMRYRRHIAQLHDAAGPSSERRVPERARAVPR